VGLAPTGKRRLVTAHALNGRCRQPQEPSVGLLGLFGGTLVAEALLFAQLRGQVPKASALIVATNPCPKVISVNPSD
jgi:hypothetical protein